MFIADLHIHSKFSRACSKDCDIEHLSWWALRKGLTVLGTGDFTHPAWSAELKETLVPAEPGLFRIRPDLEKRLDRDTPAACAGPVRFMLSVEHIFAVETGLSSDPPMNWSCSSLDDYRLVSNSDAHSPPMLGREATVFDTPVDYFAMAAALRTGGGLAGTIEFFPEEGKYHLDGHRKCDTRFDPERTRQLAKTCPVCAKPLTVGVLHRVAELADRPPGFRPSGAAGFTSLVQLPEIMSEILATGPKSKKVVGEVGRLVAALGPELTILRDVPLDDLRRAGGSRLSEAIARLRRGEVIRDAGYDGEYGTIRLFKPNERNEPALFSLPNPPAPHPKTPKTPSPPNPQTPEPPTPKPLQSPQPYQPHQPHQNRPHHLGEPAAPATPAPQPPPATGSVLDGLDPDQHAAATAPGPLLIIAGPGTGKTRTLTHRIAHQILDHGTPAGEFLAITFTRRAAQEMRDRLAALCPQQNDQAAVTTFHGLGLHILREHHAAAGLAAQFGVADEAARLAAATELTDSDRAARKLLAALPDDPDAKQALRDRLAASDLVDFDSLVELSAVLLGEHPAITAGLRARWP